jgi:hypothetical protein
MGHHHHEQSSIHSVECAQFLKNLGHWASTLSRPQFFPSHFPCAALLWSWSPPRCLRSWLLLSARRPPRSSLQWCCGETRAPTGLPPLRSRCTATPTFSKQGRPAARLWRQPPEMVRRKAKRGLRSVHSCPRVGPIGTRGAASEDSWRTHSAVGLC